MTLCGQAHADSPYQNVDATAFDDRFYLAPMGSYVVTRHLRESQDAVGGTIALGRQVSPYMSFEVLGEVLHFRAEHTDTFAGKKDSPGGGGLGMNFTLFPYAPDFVKAFFIHADVVFAHRTYEDAGFGYDLPVSAFVGHGGYFTTISLRAEALFHRDLMHDEAQYNLGFRIPLGPVPVAPTVVSPEPAAIVVPAAVEPPPPAPAPPPPAPCTAPVAGQPFSLGNCKTGDSIVLRGVNFDFNKATLTLNAKNLLNLVGDELIAHPTIDVEIDGHTDGVGTAAYNLKLSVRRAAAVRTYLIEHGVAADRMTSKGFGKTMPVADNHTAEGRELNRRVELKVTQGP